MSLKTTIKSKSYGRTEKVYKTTDNAFVGNKGFRWWEAKDAGERSRQLFATVAYLKTAQQFRQRQAAQFARLYGGHSLYSFVGSNLSKMDQISTLAPNRPTYNLIASVTDTLVSRLSQSQPTPVFLTDNGDYKERNLAKKLNAFILGEFFRTKAYQIGEYILTDALVQGTGCVKILETMDGKVGLERILLTELFVDIQEAAFGDPRRMYQVKLMDRTMLESMFPKHKQKAAEAEKATIDSSSTTAQSVADLVMVVEGWALPSGEDTDDGYHSIVCSEGELFSEKWTKQTFPFVFLHHKKRQLGFWAQGVAESLLGTQLELNSLLDTISKSIKLFGVPRVFMEEGSKVNKAAFQNKIGMIIPYRGTPPIFSVSQSNAQEMYEERARLIQFGFEQEGLSMLAATSQKPAGLNSGEAQRVYQDINSDRFASLERRYTNFYVDLAYQIIDKAIDIAKREGTYKTVFTDRRKGSKEIELPDIKLLKDPFVIQAYVQSSLPKEPAGRLQKVTEMIQSNMITIQEGRRLLDFPDLGQIETLANSSEERIFYILDEIVENGVYEPPDQFMNLQKAAEIVTQYINLYSTCKLEEDKMQMLRDFFTGIQDLMMAAMPPAPVPMPPENQLALPAPLPRSEMLPQGGGGGGIPMMAEGGLVEDQKKNSNLTPELPSWLQSLRETTVPAFQQASEAVQSIPGLDIARSAFELTSPAAYAFSQAGTPTPEGGLLEQISHVPGAQVAADIPIGWKVIKGFDLNEQRLAEQIEGIKYKLNKALVSKKPEAAEKIKKYKEQIDWLQSEIYNIREKKPQLEVTRTPEELAQMGKEEGLKLIDLDIPSGSELEKFIGKRPLDEVAKKLLDDAREDAKHVLKTYKPEMWSHPEKTLYQDVSQQDVEDLILRRAKQSEEAKKMVSELESKRLAEKAAEEERLKNVVVPIEIEGGPLPGSKTKTKGLNDLYEKQSDLAEEIAHYKFREGQKDPNWAKKVDELTKQQEQITAEINKALPNKKLQKSAQKVFDDAAKDINELANAMRGKPLNEKALKELIAKNLANPDSEYRRILNKHGISASDAYETLVKMGKIDPINPGGVPIK